MHAPMNDPATPSDAAVSEPFRFSFPTSDGLMLRAERAEPSGGSADDRAEVSIVLCHPHPLHGGNMYASVIDHLFRELPSSGATVLRFNFRGVDGSDGRHDQGVGEQLDVVAAIEAAIERWPDRPVLLAGWSFGADVALAVDHPAVVGWFAIAPPLRVVDPSTMASAVDLRPTTLVIPAHDQFNAPEAARATTADWVATELHVVDGADHFLNGHLAAVTSIATTWLAAEHRAP